MLCPVVTVSVVGKVKVTIPGVVRATLLAVVVAGSDIVSVLGATVMISGALNVMVSGKPLMVVAAVMMSGSPTWVKVRVSVMVRVSAVVLEAVAAFDIKMLVPPDETTTVPDGMPTPEILWLFSTPLRLDTPVIIALPEVTMPVGVTEVAVVVPLAALDITMVVPLDETTVTPDGMPPPEISRPFVTPARLDTAVRVVLPVVTMPVDVVTMLGAVRLVAVAKFDITMVLPVDEATVVPGGMPVPVIMRRSSPR